MSDGESLRGTLIDALRTDFDGCFTGNPTTKQRESTRRIGGQHCVTLVWDVE